MLLQSNNWMKAVEILFFADQRSLVETAASRFVNEIEAAAGRTASFAVVLCGGRILRPLGQAVVTESKTRRTGWKHVHFFWGDERSVPPTDGESNYGQARQCLLEPLAIPESQVHRVRGEGNPEAAAAAASQELLRQVAVNDHGLPVLDLVLLGMGEDGHVASLFPRNQLAVESPNAVYRAVVGPKPPPRRITLTYAVIAAAKVVWVLVSGPGKESALQRSLAEGGTTPLARVLQARAHTHIFTDLPSFGRTTLGSLDRSPLFLNA
jgi:6-phosphogluconolactonase